jgi:hypothetical protein
MVTVAKYKSPQDAETGKAALKTVGIYSSVTGSAQGGSYELIVASGLEAKAKETLGQ